jgi:hypothetical protein
MQDMNETQRVLPLGNEDKSAYEELAVLMGKQSIGTIVVTYNGSGDEGDFHSPYSTCGAELTTELLNAASNVAEAAVAAQHSGWEDNGGGGGTVTISLKEPDGERTLEVAVHHSDSRQDCEPDDYNFFVEATAQPVLAGDRLSEWHETKLLMQAEGFAQITIEYAGGGDSGDFEEPYAEDGKALSFRLASLISRIAEEAVDSRHSGYHNNEGGAGHVEFVLKDATEDCFVIRVHHIDYYESSDDDQYKLLLAVPNGDVSLPLRRT